MTAIVCYSQSGNTEQAAEKVAKAINADLINLKPQKSYPDKGFRKYFWGGKSAVMGETPKLLPYSFDAQKYDRIIFAFPVWASCFAPPIRSFIKENHEGLKNKTFDAIICYSGGGADKALEKLKAFLEADIRESLILIDPKDKPTPENEAKITEFINNI